MSNLGNKEIMSRNLKRYIEASGKSRNEICNDLNISYSTLTDWINGNIYPRIDKIELLANYFGIEKKDLIEEITEEDFYYLNPESRRMAQDAFDNPNLRILFDAARDVSPEDLNFVIEMVKKLKKQ